MNIVTITAAIRTPNPVNGSHRHWAAKSKIRKRQREATMLLTRAALNATPVKLPVVVTMTRLAPSSGLDDDNLRPALKAVRDGIADVLGVDDRDPAVRWEYDQRRGPWGVEIKLEPCA